MVLDGKSATLGIEFQKPIAVQALDGIFLDGATNGDTSIRESTGDTIAFELGGTDHYTFASGTFDATGAAAANLTLDLDANTVTGTAAEFNTALQSESFAVLGTAQTFTAVNTFNNGINIDYFI